MAQLHLWYSWSYKNLYESLYFHLSFCQLVFIQFRFCVYFWISDLYAYSVQKWPSIENEWGLSKTREIFSVQEHVIVHISTCVLAKTKVCICGYMHSAPTQLQAHTHTYMLVHKQTILTFEYYRLTFWKSLGCKK